MGDVVEFDCAETRAHDVRHRHVNLLSHAERVATVVVPEADRRHNFAQDLADERPQRGGHAAVFATHELPQAVELLAVGASSNRRPKRQPPSLITGPRRNSSLMR
jgi:hypothetical protein